MEQRLVLAQRLPLGLVDGRLGALALGEVGRDADDADHAPLVVVDGRVGHHRREAAAVAPAHTELARPGPARQELRHNFGGLLGRGLGRRDLHHAAPDGLFGRPAVEFLGVTVPVGDAAFEVGGDDGLLHRVEQMRLEAHRLFGTASRRQISDVRDEAADAPRGVEVGDVGDVDVAERTVGVLQAPSRSWPRARRALARRRGGLRRTPSRRAPRGCVGRRVARAGRPIQAS